jgi:hypothetical protein
MVFPEFKDNLNKFVEEISRKNPEGDIFEVGGNGSIRVGSVIKDMDNCIRQQKEHEFLTIIKDSKTSDNLTKILVDYKQSAKDIQEMLEKEEDRCIKFETALKKHLRDAESKEKNSELGRMYFSSGKLLGVRNSLNVFRLNAINLSIQTLKRGNDND